MLMLFAIAMAKDKEPRNKVHFFIKKRCSGFSLIVKGKDGSHITVCNDYLFSRFGLTPEDFNNMKGGGIREVFLNLED